MLGSKKLSSFNWWWQLVEDKHKVFNRFTWASKNINKNAGTMGNYGVNKLFWRKDSLQIWSGLMIIVNYPSSWVFWHCFFGNKFPWKHHGGLGRDAIANQKLMKLAGGRFFDTPLLHLCFWIWQPICWRWLGWVVLSSWISTKAK